MPYVSPAIRSKPLIKYSGTPRHQNLMSSSHSSLQKCFNLTILALAFIIPIYHSKLFTLPPSHLQESMSTSPRSQTIFILDFDGTITTTDTISALFNSAIGFHAKKGRGEEMRQKLGIILKEYKKDLEAHNSRSSSRGFGSVNEMVNYQRSLKEVEKRSFDRVSKSGILGGIGDEGWRRLGAEAVLDKHSGVVLREGWEEFIERTEGRWGVVSVNFSEGWVRGVLGLGGNSEVEVLANRPDQEGVLSGFENRGRGGVMATSEGKQDAMRFLAARSRNEGEKRRLVYLGDSGTDVECLLSDGVIGIVMTKEDGASGLLDTLKGMRDIGSLRSVSEFDEMESNKAVYFAKDFREIIASSLFR